MAGLKVLWICFVWPEPDSSAAGFRTLQLLNILKQNGYEVWVCSACQPNFYMQELEEAGFFVKHIPLNDSSFDRFVTELNPQIVFFDRFMTEEQFGWRVKEFCPDSLRVLDTIDLHSLRRGRQAKIEKQNYDRNLEFDEMTSADSIREISAIFRSDLALMVSSFEIDFLASKFNIPKEMLSLCRFSYQSPESGEDFERRAHFVSIGNYNHAPNKDCFKFLHENLWPQIREELNRRGIADVELHIYGAYLKPEFLKLDSKHSGFRVLGKAADARSCLSSYRVNLAPLRFGAGIKGKVSDGWSVGTPCAASPIAAEGMHEELEFGGFVEDEWPRYVEKSVDLYLNLEKWRDASLKGRIIISKLFNSEKNSTEFLASILQAAEGKNLNRKENFVGQMLWYHKNRSTEYFSRWIEAKNLKRDVEN